MDLNDFQEKVLANDLHMGLIGGVMVLSAAAGQLVADHLKGDEEKILNSISQVLRACAIITGATSQSIKDNRLERRTVETHNPTYWRDEIVIQSGLISDQVQRYIFRKTGEVGRCDFSVNVNIIMDALQRVSCVYNLEEAMNRAIKPFSK